MALACFGNGVVAVELWASVLLSGFMVVQFLKSPADLVVAL